MLKNETVTWLANLKIKILRLEILRFFSCSYIADNVGCRKRGDRLSEEKSHQKSSNNDAKALILRSERA